MAVESVPESPPRIEYLRTDPDLPPVGIVDRSPMPSSARVVFVVLALLGGVAWTMIAVVRGENVNAVWFVIAAVCTYLIAYRFYARLVESKIVQPRDDRATTAEILENGKDYIPTDRRVLFGHHFAAIAGAGPLVGPVLAAQMGYLPGTLWIILGVVFAGAVQDFLVLSISSRRRGRSLGQMAREELGVVGGIAAMVAVFVIMIILIAVLALVVVNALAESPWGLFSIAMTIPIALFMGVYLRYLRPGRVSEVSLIGVALLLLAIVAGGWVAETDWGAEWFTLSKVTITWLMIAYGFAASVLPVWLLLAPRDYLSTFMKVGTIALLAVGILIVRPTLQMPDVTSFALEGNGPAFAGSLFPFLFITIACGALSGFHALISSGTTPKLLEKEKQTRLIGYGGMLTESFVAIMALITACVIDQHLYFVLNAPAGVTGGTPATAADYVNGLGLGAPDITPEAISQAAADVGEDSIISRTGGAPTLAFGMSSVLSDLFGGDALKSFWYHFAIMFEALFILTTVDAGTRVARFMLSDSLGNFGGTGPPVQGPVVASGRVAVLAAGRGRVGCDPADGRHRSTRGYQHPLPAVRHRQPAARRDRPDGRAHRGDEEGPVQMGMDPGRSARVGPDRDDDRLVAEDLLGGSRDRVLDPALRLPGRQGRRGDQFPVRDEPRRDRRGDPQHLHPGHTVDRVRESRADRRRRGSHRVRQGVPGRRAAHHRGSRRSVEDLRPGRVRTHGRRETNTAPVGRAHRVRTRARPGRRAHPSRSRPPLGADRSAP